MQLLSVACARNVHLFEYSEEDENRLVHVANIPQPDVTQLAFVDYILVMVQEKPAEEQVKLLCYDPEAEAVEAETTIARAADQKVQI